MGTVTTKRTGVMGRNRDRDSTEIRRRFDGDKRYSREFRERFEIFEIREMVEFHADGKPDPAGSRSGCVCFSV